jgi:orotidine-5'-phosphate decarboxylase
VHNFPEKLARALESSGGLLCVGLDPDPDKLPAHPAGSARDAAHSREPAGTRDPAASEDPLLAFGRRIVDATCDLAAAYKPQIAFYAAQGAEAALAATIDYIRIKAPHALIILDAKRGDIGNTAIAYAREAFERYGADAVTVNPYMGEDAVKPFLGDATRGAIVLCRTSNPGARDFQDLDVGGLPLYRRVAERAARAWNQHGNLMLVVGATYPAEMAQLRRAHPELTFLVPGIGAQGGDLAAILDAGLNAAGTGLLISASRSINYAGGPDAIRAAARDLHNQINHGRGASAAA